MMQNEPYFREDGLLVDPRPIGEWSIRWCPEEEFDYSDEDTVIDPERLISQLGERAEIFRKWISIGMTVRFEAGIAHQNASAPPVFMFETTDPAVASRMVTEAGIVWWRSSIFNVEYDEDEMNFSPDAPPTAQADGYENLSNTKFRAHLIFHNGVFGTPLEQEIEAVLRSYGFELICGAHGNYTWYVSPNELSQEQIDAMRSEIMGVGNDQISHVDVSTANLHDITEGPLLLDSGALKPRRKRRRQTAKRQKQPAPKGRRAEAAEVFAREGEWTGDDVTGILMDPRYAGVGDFPPIIDEKTWIDVQVKLIADRGPEGYVRALFDNLNQAFSGYADMLANHISEPEGMADPRSTDEIREHYLQGKREYPDDPIFVELCDAGLALLDAEVALHDAPLGTRSKARAAVKKAQYRMDMAARAMEAATDDNQLAFLRKWKSSDTKPH